MYLYFHPRDRAWIEEHYDLTKYEAFALDYAPPGHAYITNRPIEDNVVAADRDVGYRRRRLHAVDSRLPSWREERTGPRLS